MDKNACRYLHAVRRHTMLILRGSIAARALRFLVVPKQLKHLRLLYSDVLHY